MNKKEILIIFILAVLITVGSWLWEMVTIGIRNAHGFPFKFYWYARGGGVTDKPPFEIHYTSMIPQCNYLNLLIDFLFWFLVIFGIWKAVKLIKKKKA